jgi:hypothetical protein
LKSIKNTLKLAGAIATVAAVSPMSIFALEDTVDIKTGVDFNTIKGLQPSGFVAAAINLLLGASGIMAFFILLIGGVQWILAGGDKEGTEKARKKITSALVGLAIVFSAYALIFIIQTLFGIDVLKVTLKAIPATAQ